MPVHGGLPPRALLDALPAAIYTTDAEGRILLQRRRRRALGRQPVIGEDRWCGSWRLYLPDGAPLRRQDRPMEIALREKRAVRHVEAVAGRPDSTLVAYMPYSTPLHEVEIAVPGDAANSWIAVSRQRVRDVGGSVGLRARALLQHQGFRARRRDRPEHGVRVCRPVGWQPRADQRPGSRKHGGTAVPRSLSAMKHSAA